MKDLSPSQQDTLKTLTIIVSVLIGVLTLSMIISVVRYPFFKGDVPGGKPVLLSYLALGTSLLALLVIRPLLVSALSRSRDQEGQVDPDRPNSDFTQTFLRCTLVEQALFEGMGHFNLAAYVAERQIWSLLVTTAIILWMVFRFPKRRQAERWIEDMGEARRPLSSRTREVEEPDK